MRSLKRVPLVTLLAGCSSGRLAPAGEFDPTGVPIDYLMNGCVCLVANLWDVTDKDIDRLVEHALERWGLLLSTRNQSKSKPALNYASDSESEDHGDNVDLALAVSQSRDKCVLPYLVGAAAVVYGIPM